MISWLTKDFGIKVISFFLAVGLWYYAVGEENVSIKRTVPLEIIMDNTKMSILKTSAKHVQVTLIGSRAMLSDMTSSDIRAVHRVGSELTSAGEYTFRLEPSEITISNPQIRVEVIEPSYIVVTVDELIVKKLGVQPNFVGEPAFGYKVSEEEMQLDPNAIMAEGPKGELEKMDVVKTERIDLIGRVRSFRKTTKLDIPPSIKPLSEALIDVFVSIKEDFVEAEITNVPVKIVRTSDSGDKKADLSPATVTASLKGSKKAIEKVTAETLFAFVDISALAAGETEVPVNFILPQEVQLQADTPKVKVSIKGK